jgi:phage I-like protein
MDTTYLIDDYVTTKAGEGYRLFPFGKIVKNGHVREITPELAAQFKLPHFQPAIKLGSHDETTPAGGHIKALEVRSDGLYAIPEWNEKGETAMRDGAYKYHSPEVIWSEGALENPTDGSMINGPLIVGDSLLHMPHLGEAAKLYSVETITGDKPMSEENVSVPAKLWDAFTAFLLKKNEPVEIVKEVIPEDYTATKQERDEFKSKLEAQERDANHKVLVEKYETELKDTKVDPSLAELLADLPEEKAGLVMRQFKALSEQINDTSLIEEKGKDASGVTGDPKAEFNTVVLTIAKEKGIPYTAAFEVVKVSHADLFKSAFAK